MPTADWLPPVAAVGAVLRSRTKDDEGVEMGTFTPDTRPTGDQTSELIDQAQADVAAEVGDVPEVLWPAARRVTALGAALQVELTYFPEQVATGRSPYEQLRDQYRDALTRLTAQVGEVNSGDVLGTGDDPGMPSYGFPENLGGMIGNGTRW